MCWTWLQMSGILLTVKGLHSFSCIKSSGCFPPSPDHTSGLNETIDQTLVKADLPAIQESSRRDYSDGKCADELTMFPFSCIKYFLRDIACANTFVLSYLMSVTAALFTANWAKVANCMKYRHLTSSNLLLLRPPVPMMTKTMFLFAISQITPFISINTYKIDFLYQWLFLYQITQVT